jgi:hypothetical protein
VKQILTDPGIPKLGWNLKMEERWCLRHLGARVRGWAFDGMIGAHVLDNRKGVTSLDFQAFVRLGQPNWKADMADYLEPKEPGGNNPNRVRKCDPVKLLKYCGLDALMEFEVCQLMFKEMGWTPY